LEDDTSLEYDTVTFRYGRFDLPPAKMRVKLGLSYLLRRTIIDQYSAVTKRAAAVGTVLLDGIAGGAQIGNDRLTVGAESE
jgi:hypothetical protein